MKKILQSALIGLVISFCTACDKYLDLEPIDNVSGNNFWLEENNVEAFTQDLYFKFRKKVGQSGSYYPTFDLRCGLQEKRKTSGGVEEVNYLAKNDILGMAKLGRWDDDQKHWLQYYTLSEYLSLGNYRFKELTLWDEYFEIIQKANILVREVDKNPTLSETEKAHYKAEGIFMRNLCYFFMVRLYGDLPYYTEAFHNKSLGRTPMVEVLKNCIADLEPAKDDLPWTYADPSKIAIRAMKGSAIALLMHMNMWLAGFDQENKTTYYEAVKALGLELDQSPNYGLIAPLNTDNTKYLFKGRTREGLFEILQNANYGEDLPARATISWYGTHLPYRSVDPTKPLGQSKSEMFLNKDYVEKYFPDGGGRDDRLVFWYEELTNEDGKMQLLKFINTHFTPFNTLENDDNIIVFRLSGAYLLVAEALAELGEDGPAQEYLNRVRRRANAEEITEGGNKLKEEIFWERVRELYGEGHFYFDLVRTRKVMDGNYTPYPIGVVDFAQGAWTWPIDKGVLETNPLIELNNYWL